MQRYHNETGHTLLLLIANRAYLVRDLRNSTTDIAKEDVDRVLTELGVSSYTFEQDTSVFERIRE